MQELTLQAEITQRRAPPLPESGLHPRLQRLAGAYVRRALMQKRGLASELAQKFSSDGRECDLTRVTIKIHYAQQVRRLD